jgi:glucose-1-phosphate adenylyltransferase
MQYTDWYQGTADAVRKQKLEIRSTHAPYVLILAGDHLYHMDYAAMARLHWEKDADITVAVQPVSVGDAGRFGILKRDADLRLTDFAEKPKDPGVLSGLASRDDPQRPYLGSMGIYMFKTSVLFDLLENDAFDDFGGDVIPNAISTHRVFGYDFDGYWEDIGTIRSFYETNLALTRPDSPFNFYETNRPIYSHPRHLPGSIVENSHLEHVLLAEGCCIQSARIKDSIIGLRSQIKSGVSISESIIMGADYYDRTDESYRDNSDTPLGIGPGSTIEGAIVDKNTRIGEGVVIKRFPQGADIDGENWVVRDGIVVVPKSVTIKPGTIISPRT